MKNLFQNTMKNHHTHIAIGVLMLLVACSKKDATTTETPPPVTNITKVAPDGFNYTTNKTVNISITLLTNTDQPLNNIPVKVSFYKDGEIGEVALTAITNTQGVINTTLSVPAYVDTMIVDPQSLGLLHNAKVFLAGNALNCTLGGTEVAKGNVAGTFSNEPPMLRTESNIATLGAGGTGAAYKAMGKADVYGRPLYLEATGDVISAEMLSYISYSLPEGKSVAKLHPEFIADGTTSNINISKTSEIWVTFIYEGAGYKNTIGYYVYDTKNPPKNAKEIDTIYTVLPNASMSFSGGNMKSGDKISLGVFDAGKTIGFVLFADAWRSYEKYSTSASTFYTNSTFNPESDAALKRHTVLLNNNGKYIIGFEDINRQLTSCDQDFNDVCIYASSNPIDAISNEDVQKIIIPSDTDGDGVSDVYDDFPNDATRAYISYFPSENTWGTLAFEDLWPVTGDYDLNDLVVNYRYKFIANAQNSVVEFYADYAPLAAGATYYNGFGIQFPFSPSDVKSITGQSPKNSFIKLNSNGTEAGQTKAVIIPFDDHSNLISNPGNAAILNTDMTKAKMKGDTSHIYLQFNTPISKISLGTAPFNPFAISNKRRNYEVHLPGQLPTDLAEKSLLGTLQDATNASTNTYFLTKDNHPWALSFTVPFTYPIEGVDISKAYLHFSDWAKSGGTLYTDWYSNTSAGYRNTANLYTK
jgi:LruC domain-containing protein